MQNNNEEFTLSIAAQNVEAQFYGKKAIVYVEGQDDLHFWKPYFSEKNFELRQVDGCRNLDDYINDVLHNGLKCIVACDADYSQYQTPEVSNPLIIHTLSHSIECVMYCPYNLNECIKKLSRSFQDKIDEIQACYDQFGNDIRELVAFDIANNIYGKGVSICGDSCVRFLSSNSSTTIDTNRLVQFISSVSHFFSDEELT